MERVRAIRFRLRPTEEQALLFRRTAGCCRALYNAALVQRQMTWEQRRVSVRYAAQAAELRELKAAFPWLGEAPHHCLQQTLRDLDRAYQGFFTGQSGYPRPKKKGRSRDSFRFPDPKQIQVEAARIRLPKAGWVELCLSKRQRCVEGEVRQVTVSFEAGHWYASVLCRTEVSEPVAPTGGAVGVDLGVVSAVTTSEGTVFQMPVLSRREEAKLAFLQRQVAMKKRGSRNRQKARERVGRFHAKQRRRRIDRAHKITRHLAKNHSRVVIEDLRVRSMTASARGTAEAPGSGVRQKAGLNRAILQRLWGEMRRHLEYKCPEEGSVLVVVPAPGTSITCRVCGHRSKESRASQAVFCCVQCGHTEPADVHAAKNIKAAGVAV